MNYVSLSCGGNGNWDRLEVPEHHDSDDHDAKEDKKPLSGVNKEKEEHEAVTVMTGRHAPAAKSLPPMIVKEIKAMFLRLGFSQTVAQKLVDDQGKDSP